MAAVTFSWGVTLAVKKEVTGDKEGKAEERGKRWGICIRQVAIQVETRIKVKKNLSIILELYWFFTIIKSLETISALYAQY